MKDKTVSSTANAAGISPLGENALREPGLSAAETARFRNAPADRGAKLSKPKKENSKEKCMPVDEELEEIETSFADVKLPLTDEAETCGDSHRCYIREIAKFPLLGPDEERELARLAAAGDKKAADKLIQANLRLVVSVAKRYAGGRSLQDLIQEGNLGLMKAVEKFDPDRGFRFSTYGIWWIRQAITRYIADRERIVRLPVYKVEQINRLISAERALKLKLCREPTDGELCSELDISLKELDELRGLSADAVSLDAPICGEGDTCLGDAVPDGRVCDPLAAVYLTALRETMEKALNTLTVKERDVIRLRYGLDDDLPRTLAELGTRFGLSRERIRQIEEKALRKLFAQSKTTGLRDFVAG